MARVIKIGVVKAGSRYLTPDERLALNDGSFIAYYPSQLICLIKLSNGNVIEHDAREDALRLVGNVRLSAKQIERFRREVDNGTIFFDEKRMRFDRI